MCVYVCKVYICVCEGHVICTHVDDHENIYLHISDVYIHRVSHIYSHAYTHTQCTDPASRIIKNSTYTYISHMHTYTHTMYHAYTYSYVYTYTQCMDPASRKAMEDAIQSTIERTLFSRAGPHDMLLNFEVCAEA